MFKKITSRLHKKISKGITNARKVTMCRSCHSFYYRNVWHFEAPGHIQREAAKTVPFRLTECPSCLEIEAATEERDGFRVEESFSLGESYA